MSFMNIIKSIISEQNIQNQIIQKLKSFKFFIFVKNSLFYLFGNIISYQNIFSKKVFRF
jgi:hypothetical protein